MANKIFCLRRLLLFILCASPCFAAPADVSNTLRFGVFSLFKPTRLLIHPANDQIVLLTINKASVVVDSELEVRLSSDGVRIVTDGHKYRAESLLISSRHGGASDFALTIPGKISRKFHGTLEVTQAGHHLEAIVVMDRELA